LDSELVEKRVSYILAMWLSPVYSWQLDQDNALFRNVERV
jgi:hypothetical protein